MKGRKMALRILPAMLLGVLFCAPLASCGGSGDDGPEGPGEVITEAVLSSGVADLSGMCYTRDKKGFLLVSDQGRIYQAGMDGVPTRRLPYAGGNDFEGITMNYATGDIYLADEGAMKVYRLIDEASLQEVVAVNITAQPNKGIEGVAYGRGVLYIVNQQSPRVLVKYNLLTGVQNPGINITYATHLSDICYDDTDDTLWIVDSSQRKVFHCGLDGVKIAEQAVPDVEKGEALLVDRRKGCMWIGCDATGKIYRKLLAI